MSYGFGFMIESLVAILLGLTIAYCFVLNNRLKRPFRSNSRIAR